MDKINFLNKGYYLQPPIFFPKNLSATFNTSFNFYKGALDFLVVEFIKEYK